MGLALIVLAVIIFVCFYMYFASKLNYWERRGVKCVPNPIPFFGNMIGCLIRRHTRAGEQLIWYDMFPEEKYVGFYMFIMPVLMIRDPQTIHDVMTKDFPYFYNRGIPFEEDDDPLSSHLVNLKDEKWKIVRKKLTPCFSSSKLKIMFELLEECVNELGNFFEEEIQNGCVVDVHDVMVKFSIDVIGSCTYGLNFNSLRSTGSEFSHLGQDIFKSHFRFVLRFFLRQIHSKLPTLLGLRVVDPKLESFFLNFVKEVVEFREKNDVRKNDFLQILIDMRREDISILSNSDRTNRRTLDDPGKSKTVIFSDKDLASNMAIFFVAGFETTSTTMSLCLMELAANPSIQEKVLQEILLTLEQNNNVLDYDVIKNMSYMEMVLNETMRKYPVAISILRECKKAYLFPGTTFCLQERKSVIIPVYALHHDPKYYPKPEVFNPERFSEENKGKIPPGAYLPFGDGPRICIGIKFAMMEMKLAFCKILLHYKFNMCDKIQYPVKFDESFPILIPKNGIWLKVTKRVIM